MAEQTSLPGVENSETAGSTKTKSGVELLDEIKSHEFVYKKSAEDVKSFTKMMNALRGDGSFTDLTVCVKVSKIIKWCETKGVYSVLLNIATLLPELFIRCEVTMDPGVFLGVC